MEKTAVVLSVLSVLAGIISGAGVMSWYGRRCRTRELQKISRLAGKILNGQKLPAASAGEETLAAKIGHQMVRVQEMLEGRRVDAEKSRDEIQKLISETAHQMRTPLANMETYLELLKGESRCGEMVPGALDALEESEKKLRFLAENFIKMSRLEQGLIQIRREAGDLLDTVRNAFGQIQSQAEEKRIDFDIRLPEQAECPHDPNWMGEAVYNLLENAVKYSPVGGRVGVSVLESEMFLKIRVRDQGIGIEPGEEPEIFRRFYRGRRVRGQEGFGIGLYLAREIVDRHGGFLTAKRLEEGLLMEISLPR